MNLQMLNKATKRHEMEVSLSEWGTVTGILEIRFSLVDFEMSNFDFIT